MAPTHRIALVTGARMPKPDPESHLLVAALAELGIAADVLPWDSATDWAAYPLVVVRTPWEYFARLDAFLAWCARVETATRLVNPRAIVAWNSHKGYLRELAARGLPVVPTLWLERGSPDGAARLAAATWPQVVVKPAVSIGAIGTRLDAPGAAGCRAHVEALLTEGDVMVQPYLPGIAESGEVSLIFFAGRFSHAIRKRPKAGDYRVQDLYGGTVETCQPAADEIELAGTALQLTPVPTTYARVDLVRHDGRPLIMELELIEPELFLGASPEAARRFAAALQTQLAEQKP